MPCEAIYEPDWRTGTHIPTRFTARRRRNPGRGRPWAPWKDPATGKWADSFTMLTINADTHPTFKEITGPDPARPLHAQDKRMVVILPEAQYEAWLNAPAQRSMDFMNQFPAERLAMVAEHCRRRRRSQGRRERPGAAATVVALLSRPWARDCRGNRRSEGAGRRHGRWRCANRASLESYAAGLLQPARASGPRPGPTSIHFRSLTAWLNAARIRPTFRFTVARTWMSRLRAIHSSISCVRMSECLSLAGGALHHFMRRSPFPPHRIHCPSAKANTP